MKWNEKRRKAYGIDLDTISETTMSPKLRITIGNVSITSALTNDFIQDLRFTTHSEEIIDNIIDEEIESHPNFKKIIRKKKLEEISKINN